MGRLSAARRVPSYEGALLLPPCSLTSFYKWYLSQGRGRNRKKGLKKTLLPPSHPYAKLFYEKMQGKKETPTRRTCPRGVAPSNRQDGCEPRFSFVSRSSPSAPPRELPAGAGRISGFPRHALGFGSNHEVPYQRRNLGRENEPSRAAPSPGPYGDAAPSLTSCRRDGVLVGTRGAAALPAGRGATGTPVTFSYTSKGDPGTTAGRVPPAPVPNHVKPRSRARASTAGVTAPRARGRGPRTRSALHVRAGWGTGQRAPKAGSRGERFIPRVPPCGARPRQGPWEPGHGHTAFRRPAGLPALEAGRQPLQDTRAEKDREGPTKARQGPNPAHGRPLLAPLYLAAGAAGGA